MGISNREPHAERGIEPFFDLSADQIEQIPTRKFDRNSLPKDPSDVSTDRESLMRCIELGRREFNDPTAIFKEMVVNAPNETLLEVAKLIKQLEESILSDTQVWEGLDENGNTPQLFDFYKGFPNAVASEDEQKLRVPVADRASLLAYLDNDSVLEAIWEAHGNDLDLPDDWEFADIQLNPDPESKLANLEPFYQALPESELFEMMHAIPANLFTDPVELLKSVIKDAPLQTLIPIIFSLQKICPAHDPDGNEYYVLQQPIRAYTDLQYSPEGGIITFDITSEVIQTEILYALTYNSGFISNDALREEFELWAERQSLSP
jgi:hypothetical protein